MLFMLSHLTQRSGIFYFRARVRTHLVQAFGRSVVSLSLGTRDPAEARRRVRERRVEFERALAQVEATSTSGTRDDDWRGSVLHLSDDDIDALCERYRAQRLAEDEQQRAHGLTVDAHELDLLDIALPRLRSAYARGELTDAHAGLQRFLVGLGLKLSRTSPSHKRLAVTSALSAA